MRLRYHAGAASLTRRYWGPPSGRSGKEVPAILRICLFCRNGLARRVFLPPVAVLSLSIPSSVNYPNAYASCYARREFFVPAGPLGRVV